MELLLHAASCIPGAGLAHVQQLQALCGKRKCSGRGAESLATSMTPAPWQYPPTPLSATRSSPGLGFQSHVLPLLVHKSSLAGRGGKDWALPDFSWLYGPHACNNCSMPQFPSLQNEANNPTCLRGRNAQGWAHGLLLLNNYQMTCRGLGLLSVCLIGGLLEGSVLSTGLCI